MSVSVFYMASKVLLDSLIVSSKISESVSLVHGFVKCLFFNMGISRQGWIRDSWADGSLFSNWVVPTKKDSYTNVNP